MPKSIHIKKTKINGRDVRYYTAGQGYPLMVIHGGGGDARTWLKNIVALSDKYTVYVPDLPGFGESQPLDDDYYIPELTEFVGYFADNLGLQSFYLVGHSIGGGIALNYALKYPHKVKKLVLVSSVCLGREIALWIRLASIPARTIKSSFHVVLRVAKWLVKTKLIPSEFKTLPTQTSLNFGSSIATLKEQAMVLANYLSGLMVPTLVVWGKKDAIVPVRHAYVAAQVIPDCQLKIFENHGHSVYRDEIHEFSQLLKGFLG